jgi:enoyl-CoA hydratase
VSESYQTLLVSTDEGVVTVTLNRPERLNAMTRDMAQELHAVLDRVAGDAEARVLLFTGAGRAFMAGADISVFRDMDPLAGKRFAQRAHQLMFRLEALEIPVIAGVNGFALGGGLELALACDLIYAAESARFGLPEITLGIIPCVGGTQRLARLLGKGLAKDLCFSGRFLDAEEARDLGLAARVFPDLGFLGECQNAARIIANKGRVALRAVKQVIDRGATMDLPGGCALEIEAFAVCLASPDAQEGVRAFLEKREPKFTGGWE